MELDFRKNLGGKDRVIRVAIALALLALAAGRFVTGWMAALAIVLALSQFAEGFAGY